MISYNSKPLLCIVDYGIDGRMDEWMNDLRECVSVVYSTNNNK